MKYSADRIDWYFGKPLSVLALWQPWATLCVARDPLHAGEPAKRHETRSWFPQRATLPMCVAIHAAKKFDTENRDTFSTSPFREALKRAGFYPGDPRPFAHRGVTPPSGLQPVPLGAIVGVATVTGFYSATSPRVPRLELDSLSADDRAFGNFIPNELGPRFAWRLEKAILLPEPIAHTGRQEPLYPVDVHDLDRITTQLRQLRAEAA